jgi:hypothetical protein
MQQCCAVLPTGTCHYQNAHQSDQPHAGLICQMMFVNDLFAVGDNSLTVATTSDTYERHICEQRPGQDASALDGTCRQAALHLTDTPAMAQQCRRQSCTPRPTPLQVLPRNAGRSSSQSAHSASTLWLNISPPPHSQQEPIEEAESEELALSYGRRLPRD